MALLCSKSCLPARPRLRHIGIALSFGIFRCLGFLPRFRHPIARELSDLASNKKLLVSRKLLGLEAVARASLLGARTLLVAPGIATRNKKLLGARGNKGIYY